MNQLPSLSLDSIALQPHRYSHRYRYRARSTESCSCIWISGLVSVSVSVLVQYGSVRFSAFRKVTERDFCVAATAAAGAAGAALPIPIPIPFYSCWRHPLEWLWGTADACCEIQLRLQIQLQIWNSELWTHIWPSSSDASAFAGRSVTHVPNASRYAINSICLIFHIPDSIYQIPYIPDSGYQVIDLQKRSDHYLSSGCEECHSRVTSIAFIQFLYIFDQLIL